MLMTMGALPGLCPGGVRHRISLEFLLERPGGTVRTQVVGLAYKVGYASRLHHRQVCGRVTGPPQASPAHLCVSQRATLAPTLTKASEAHALLPPPRFCLLI